MHAMAQEETALLTPQELGEAPRGTQRYFKSALVFSALLLASLVLLLLGKSGLGMQILALEEKWNADAYAEDKVDAAVRKKLGVKRPHVIMILADDYGWANLGIHRGGWSPEQRQAKAEVHTPNLDRLIRTGILLDRHYSYKICSPSRSALQSGRFGQHVNSVNTGVTYWNPADNVSGYAGIPRNMTGIAQKMKQGGYRTHMVGKWDAGMATPEQTPYGMGYESWLGYFQHANDYWQESMPLASTGNIDVCLNKYRDFSLYNSTYRAGVTKEIAAELGCTVDVRHSQRVEENIESQVNITGCLVRDTDYCLPDSCYEEAMFNKYALDIIENHNQAEPLFLFYAFHLLHSPLQIPQSYIDKIDEVVARHGGQPFDSQNRRLYAAMTLYMDEMVGKLVDALVRKGMWEDTLVIFMADNGGPVYEPGAANNHPLKGGKYSDWEGGVRTNAFVSGGSVPAHRRGQVYEGIVSIADWYATLSSIAGVPYYDFAAAKANSYLKENGLPLLPPVDGRTQLANVLLNRPARDELQLSEYALLEWPFKLVRGKQPYSFYQGELYPNCSTISKLSTEGPLFYDAHVFGLPLLLSTNETVQEELTKTVDCGDRGCLYHVQMDPGEHVNLADVPGYQKILFKMNLKLNEMNKRNFNPNRGEPALQACVQGAELGAYYGPFVFQENFYEGVNLDIEEELQAKLNIKEVTLLNETLTENNEEYITNFTESYGLLDLINGNNTHLDVCFEGDLTTVAVFK